MIWCPTQKYRTPACPILTTYVQLQGSIHAILRVRPRAEQAVEFITNVVEVEIRHFLRAVSAGIVRYGAGVVRGQL